MNNFEINSLLCAFFLIGYLSRIVYVEMISLRKQYLQSARRKNEDVIIRK
jgi:hypothetical protein